MDPYESEAELGSPTHATRCPGSRTRLTVTSDLSVLLMEHNGNLTHGLASSDSDERVVVIKMLMEKNSRHSQMSVRSRREPLPFSKRLVERNRR